LKLLLKNARISDTSIAEKLNISSQAVGRIRKELEDILVKEYSLKLDPKELGIEIFALIKAQVKDLRKRKEVEKQITDCKNTTSFFKTINSENNYIIIMGFRNVSELDKFLNEPSLENPIRENFIIKEAIPFCPGSVLKDSQKDFLELMIDSCSNKSTKISF